MLVLGSLPGEASLSAQRYYAHPRNQFWALAGAVIGRDDLPALAYAERLAALLRNGVGLWDVVRSGKREGSLDAALREVEGNDLAALAARLPTLRAIGFNGATAARIGRRQLGGSETGLPGDPATQSSASETIAPKAVTLIDLPSSSPAYAALPFAGKQERWLALRRFLYE